MIVIIHVIRGKYVFPNSNGTEKSILRMKIDLLFVVYNRFCHRGNRCVNTWNIRKKTVVGLNCSKKHLKQQQSQVKCRKAKQHPPNWLIKTSRLVNSNNNRCWGFIAFPSIQSWWSWYIIERSKNRFWYKMLVNVFDFCTT